MFHIDVGDKDMGTLKQNLIDRSAEIHFKLEQELVKLDAPCSMSDMIRRVGATRMPVENHLKTILAGDKFSDISIVKIGTYDVIYRRAEKPR